MSIKSFSNPNINDREVHIFSWNLRFINSNLSSQDFKQNE